MLILFMSFTGCSNEILIIGDEPPSITVLIGDNEIDWVVGLNYWNGSQYDRLDIFNSIMSRTTFDELPSFRNGEVITIIFDGEAPDSFTLTEFILTETGQQRFNIPGMVYDVDFDNDNTLTFTIEPNFATALSSNSRDFEQGSTIKGFRLVSNWGDNVCEYAFIIRGDAAISVVVEDIPDRELRIRENFLAWLYEKGRADLTLDDVAIARYYGTFDGREVVFMDVRDAIFDEAVLEHEVAGYNFVFGNMGWYEGHYRSIDEWGVTISTYGVHIWLHDSGEFICICDGYERGFLTAEDIGAIWTWDRWYGWFNSLSEESQATISLRPPSMSDIATAPMPVTDSP